MYTISLITLGLALVYFRLLYRRGVRGMTAADGDATTGLPTGGALRRSSSWRRSLARPHELHARG
jgi:hypothetical protein